MKKFIKHLFIICLFFNIIGCVKEVTYDEDDFKITLSEEYKKRTGEMFNYYYQDNTNIITVLKEEISTLENININDNSSTEDYLKVAAEINNKEGKIISESNYSYMEYESNDYYHLAVVFKSKDSFWTINFLCLKKDKDANRNKFFKYMKTIEV